MRKRSHRMFNVHQGTPDLRVQMAEDGDELTLYLYDEIGGWFGVTANELRFELDRAPNAKRINLRINSPGGDVFEAMGMYRILKDHAAEVHVRIDGIAASAASFLAMAGDTVVMASRAMMMTHEGWAFTIGDAATHRTRAVMLDKISDSIAGLYADRAGNDVAHWRGLMLAETWYTDDEAVAAGLADSIDREGSAAADNMFDLSMYHNAPPSACTESGDDAAAPAAALSERERAMLSHAKRLVEAA